VKEKMNSDIHAFHCHFCDAVVVSQWGKLQVCKNGKADIAYRLCLTCYDKVQRAVKQALTEVIKQMLQDSLAEFKQELQTAGWKK
jgi:hypothetical protein